MMFWPSWRGDIPHFLGSISIANEDVALDEQSVTIRKHNRCSWHFAWPEVVGSSRGFVANQRHLGGVSGLNPLPPGVEPHG